MKRIFTLIAAFTISYAAQAQDFAMVKKSGESNSILNLEVLSEESPAVDECTVELLSMNCYLDNALECFKTKLEGSTSYRVHITRCPYDGVGECYQVYYDTELQSGISRMSENFTSKKEAIKGFISTAYGSSCRYVYN